MPISRRSFLAAVMGAIAAPVAAGPFSPARADFFDPGMFSKKLGLWHWTVWDSLTITPGAVVNERLLPPPMPDDFVLTGFGPHYPAESRLESLGCVARQVNCVLKRGNVDLIDARLFHLPPGNISLALPVAFTRGDNDLGIYLHSHDEQVRSVDPITVTIVLQGFIRQGAGV